MSVTENTILPFEMDLPSGKWVSLRDDKIQNALLH
jgi:hypothetical protein